jgi:tripeptidyl-peptidase-1
MSTWLLENQRLLVTSKLVIAFAPFSVLTLSRYHVPAQIQEHVDYITPGIKLFWPNQKDRGDMDIDKRTFGVTGQKGKAGLSPPLSKPLGLPLSELLSLVGLAGCGEAITPSCVAGMSLFLISTRSDADQLD